MKKGFTLVELLAVVIILGIISLIIIPTVNDNINDSKKKLYNVQINEIKLEAEKWATDNLSELDSEYLNATYVSLAMLQNQGYIEKGKIKNPLKSKDYMNGCVAISYDSDTKSYKYDYDNDNIECDDTSKSGYYYTYNLDQKKWNLNTSHANISVGSYLIGENASNVVASDSGLYDLEDRYVFRGNVNNNYVTINKTYFRIIGIDKTTRELILVSTNSSANNVWNQSGIDYTKATINTDILAGITKYDSLIANNSKWNIGLVDSMSGLNLDVIMANEKTSQITTKVGIISLSEYMNASIDSSCVAGNLGSCGNNNYLNTDKGFNFKSSWTLTANSSNNKIAMINTSGGVEWKASNEFANIFAVIHIKPALKNGTGTYSDPFIINTL